MNNTNLQTVAAITQKYSAFTAGAVRNILYRAEDRVTRSGQTIKGNGLAAFGAVVKVGRKVLIDETRFNAWPESHRKGGAS